MFRARCLGNAAALQLNNALGGGESASDRPGRDSDLSARRGETRAIAIRRRRSCAEGDAAGKAEDVKHEIPRYLDVRCQVVREVDRSTNESAFCVSRGYYFHCRTACAVKRAQGATDWHIAHISRARPPAPGQDESGQSS